MHCRHCSDLFKGPKSELPLDAILNFQRSLSTLGKFSSVVTGGEPTLHSEFDEIVEGLSAFGPVTVTTNGLSFAAHRAETLLRRCPHLFIQVSFDGVRKETFESQRGKNTFNRVVRFVEDLCQKELGGRMGLSMTLTTSNYAEAMDLLAFAKGNGISTVHFPQLIPIGNARTRWSSIALNVDAQVGLEHLLLEQYAELATGVHMSVNRLERIAAWYLHGQTADCLRTLTLRITPDGWIVPCPTAAVDRFNLGKIDEYPQPDKLLQTLNERGEELRLFASTGKTCASQVPDIPKPSMRTCESCWMLGQPDPQIARYGEQINAQHMHELVHQLHV